MTGQPKATGRYLTVDETADLLRTTPKAIRRLIEKGLLAHAVRRIGRRVLISEGALIASLESGGLSACCAAPGSAYRRRTRQTDGAPS